MRQFFLFTSLWAILIIGADFAITKLFDSIYERVQTGQTGGEINHYLSLKSVPPVLIMGNSRARYQVNPDSFALPTYSLCHAGMGQVFQTGLVYILAQEKKLPRMIMLHIDLAEYVGNDDLEDIGNLRYFYRKNQYVTEYIDDISRFEKIKYIFKFYRYNGRVISTLKNFVQSRGVDIKGNGYQPIAAIPNDSTTFIEVTNPKLHPKFHYQNLRHLQKFLDLCQHDRIKVICFTSPYFSTRAFIPVVASPIDSLLHIKQIPYFNAALYPLPVLTHHARFWQDSDHLNQLGAGYLSRQLAQWSKPFLLADSTIQHGR
jgi:hypothetical protein